MSGQKSRGKKVQIISSFNKNAAMNKTLDEQEQESNYQDQSANDEYRYLAHRDELSKDDIFFIAIKLPNNQYIYELINSKEKASYLYSFAINYDENLKSKNFYLIDNDNDEIVNKAEPIYKTLKAINKGNTRTRFSLSVRY